MRIDTSQRPVELTGGVIFEVAAAARKQEPVAIEALRAEQPLQIDAAGPVQPVDVAQLRQHLAVRPTAPGVSVDAGELRHRFVGMAQPGLQVSQALHEERDLTALTSIVPLRVVPLTLTKRCILEEVKASPSSWATIILQEIEMGRLALVEQQGEMLLIISAQETRRYGN